MKTDWRKGNRQKRRPRRHRRNDEEWDRDTRPIWHWRRTSVGCFLRYPPLPQTRPFCCCSWTSSSSYSSSSRYQFTFRLCLWISNTFTACFVFGNLLERERGLRFPPDFVCLFDGKWGRNLKCVRASATTILGLALFLGFQEYLGLP